MNNDCIFSIFTFLNVNDIITCSIVCKNFNNITRNERIWKSLFTSKFKINCTIHYYDNYKLYTILNKFLMTWTYGNINIIRQKYVLNISSKSLSIIPKEIHLLTNLEQLFLHNNNIETIPIELYKLTNLKILNLSCNNLKKIPCEIKNL